MTDIFTIEDIMAKTPKSKNGQDMNNTEKRKIGIEKLAEIQYRESYNGDQKDAIVQLKKALANNSMKSYQQLKLFSKEIPEIVQDLRELATAIQYAESNAVLEDALKVYLSK
jgi:uncharacterized protein (DUF3084 family)